MALGEERGLAGRGRADGHGHHSVGVIRVRAPAGRLGDSVFFPITDRDLMAAEAVRVGVQRRMRELEGANHVRSDRHPARDS
jgi:hypothetical protein